VEGESDARALRALFLAESAPLRSALRNAHLVIDHLWGAGKLSYKLTELRNMLCGLHVFLDNDDSGRTAAERALGDGLVKPIDLHLATCPGKKHSEWEDLVTIDIYEAWVQTTFGVALKGLTFQNSKSWADRMAETFHASGKPWTDKVKAGIKARISELVEQHTASALNSSTRSAFDNLKTALEQKVSAKSPNA
jgi:hypothetical protein